MTEHEHPESRIERATESTLAKAVARFAVPLLLGVMGWLLTDLKTDVRSQSLDIGQIKSDLRDVNTRLDAGVIRQVTDNTQRINELDSRVQLLERKVP